MLLDHEARSSPSCSHAKFSESRPDGHAPEVLTAIGFLVVYEQYVRVKGNTNPDGATAISANMPIAAVHSTAHRKTA